MIWAGIIGTNWWDLLKLKIDVKIDSAGYTHTQFLEKNLMPWMKKKSAAFKKNMVSMQDNAPSHASKLTREWLAKKGIKEDHTCLSRPQPYRELLVTAEEGNSMLEENNTHQRRACGMRWWQFTKRLRSDVVQNLTVTMDSRLMKIIEKKGEHLNM